MKIAFTGSQCTGKSTQARILNQKYNYELVESASRITANLGVPVNRSGSLSTQFQIAGKMEEQMFISRLLPNVVWERTHIDSIAYASHCDLWSCDDMYLTCLSALAKKQLTEYFDMVFYFPAYALELYDGVLEDGVRDTDPVYRIQIAERISEELAKTGVEVESIPHGSIEFIEKWIQDKIYNKRLLKGKLKAEDVIQYINGIA